MKELRAQAKELGIAAPFGTSKEELAGKIQAATAPLGDAPDWAADSFDAPQKEYIAPAQLATPSQAITRQATATDVEALFNVRINYGIREKDGSLTTRNYILGDLVLEVGKHVEYGIDLANTLINMRSKRGYTECANLKQPPKNIIQAAYNLSFR